MGSGQRDHRSQADQDGREIIKAWQDGDSGKNTLFYIGRVLLTGLRRVGTLLQFADVNQVFRVFGKIYRRWRATPHAMSGQGPGGVPLCHRNTG